MMEDNQIQSLNQTLTDNRRAWMQALMLREPGRWSSRLGALMMWLKTLGRGQRRRFGRAAAGVLAGASGIALMALLAGPMAPAAHAATINIDATCSLVDAIRSANTDTSIGTCEAGSGADTIILRGNVALTTSSGYYSFSDTALPQITSTITIESAAGSHFTIARNSENKFRLMAVGATGNLTLRNVTLSSGYAYAPNPSFNYEGHGGAIYNLEGVVALDNVILSGNRAEREGGAVASDRTYNGGTQDPRLTITNSVITGNVTGGAGGGISVRSGVFTITHSIVSHNTSSGDGGGILADGSAAYISHVTVDNNVGNDGGGVYFDGGTNLMVNSTISSNRGEDGGGVGVDTSTNTILFTTITDNYASSEGGGVYADGADTTIRYSIISGNHEPDDDDTEIDEDSGDIYVYYSILGHAGVTYDQAFSSTSLDGSNFFATSDQDNVALEEILETTATNNGGPDLPGGYVMLTHQLVEYSPAIDFIAEPCEVDDDQVGTSRPRGDDCDAGAMEFVPTSVFVSTWAAGTVDGLSYGPADILQWDGSTWTTWFDGDDAELDPTTKWKHNLNAIWIDDAESSEFAVSFTQNQQQIGTLGWVDGYDILWWDGEAFGRWFEGERIGLNNKTQEKIDGLHVLPEAPEWSEFAGNDCEVYLLLSTQGPGLVPKPGNITPKNVLKFGGEDVLGICVTNLGPNTTGFWEMALDGSAEGVTRNNVDSISANEDGSVLYLTSKRSFIVDEASGGHSMVFAFDMETEEFSGPLFEVYDAGMAMNTKVDALHVSGPLQLP